MIYKELSSTTETFQLLDSYQGTLPHAQFLQSSRWARFQKEEGKRITLLSDESGIVILGLRQPIGAGYAYWYFPRAPFIDITLNTTAVIDSLAQAITKLDPKALFIRFEPVGHFDVASLKRTIDVQPHETLVLALKGPKESLLAQMHQKTRYNIKLAQKKNLNIKKGSEHAGAFLDLLEETSTRDKFRLHEREYYAAMIKSGVVELATIWQEDKLLAGSLMAYFGDTVTYVHGASSSTSRQLMAPYALHWHLIQEACDAGYKYYDWHGIDEKKWPGVTRFKKGFGGEHLTYAGTFDRPLAPLLYALYTVIRYLRRLF